MKKRNIKDIQSIPLNHDSGVKKILFNWQDVDTPCRQISIANNMAWTPKMMHGIETIDAPEREPWTPTHFIR